jgi:hypothetical protein
MSTPEETLQCCKAMPARSQIVPLKRRAIAFRSSCWTDEKISEQRKLLIGSYFVCEFSLESAALFNPSIQPAHRRNATGRSIGFCIRTEGLDAELPPRNPGRT